MMSSHPGLRRSAASMIVAAAALCLTGAAAAPTDGQQDSSVCQVEFTAQSDVLYNPDLDLTGRIITGRHNYSATTRSGSSTWTDFEVLDNDSFLILYVLANEWKASGLLERNRREAVGFPRTDIELALAATRMGLIYHRTLKAKVERESPANAADILALLALKIESLLVLQTGLEQYAGGSASTVELPPGFLSTRMGPMLDGLVPGPEQRTMAQYLDRTTGKSVPNVLCSHDAASAFVGQLLCGFRVTTATAREPAICPDGLRLTRLSSLPVCRRAAGVDQC